jgi:DNA-binding transcriptional MocR family regulator
MLASSTLPFAASSRPGAVVSIGSAGKTMWGGLRIGWVRAEPSLIARLVVAKAQEDLACPVLEQLTVAQLLDGFDALLARRRREFARRCRHLQEGLRARLPSWTVPDPDGGLVVWCRLPEPRSTALAQSCARWGITLAAGPRFGVDGGFESRLRLPFSRPIGELDGALDRVAQAWSEATSEPGPNPQRVLLEPV